MKELKDLVKQLLKIDGRCEKCGATDNLENVYISDFTGKGSLALLCPRCRELEKLKRY